MHRVETSALTRTLEGTKAHGRRGHRHAGNGGWVSRTQTRSKASRSTIGTIRCRSNDEGATAHGDVSTAAAGGTSSKGVNRVAGMARRFRTNASFTSVESGRSGRRDAETLRTPAGSRMQQAWKPTCGANRPCGEKPRGRTVRVSLVAGSMFFGTRTHVGDVGGGAHCFERISREAGDGSAGNCDDIASDRFGRSEDEAKDHEGLSQLLSQAMTESPCREDPGDPTGNGERSRGEQQRPTSCYRARWTESSDLETRRPGPTVS